MTSALIGRLVDEYGYPRITGENVERFLCGPGVRVLFFTGDPEQHRESNDVAVVLPELVGAFDERLYPAVVDRSAEKALRLRYGVRRLPALVFLRREGYLGTITGMQDWNEYLEQIRALHTTTPRKPPGMGVEVLTR